MTGEQRAGLALAGAFGAAFLFVWLIPTSPRSPSIPHRDCTAACAPRSVLAGPAGSCNCAPDDAWLDKMNERCGSVPYDMSMTLDGTFTYHCGRPDKMWSTPKSNSKKSPEG